MTPFSEAIRPYPPDSSKFTPMGLNKAWIVLDYQGSQE